MRKLIAFVFIALLCRVAGAAEPAGLILGLGMERVGPKGNYLNYVGGPTLYGHKTPPVPDANSPVSAPGKYGKAVALDASKRNYLDAFCAYANYGTPKHCTITNYDLDKWTLAAWVYVTPAGDDTRWEVMEKAGAYWLNIRSDTMQVRAGGFFGGCEAAGRWVYVDSAAKVRSNTWTHVAATYDGAAIRIYVNGNLSAQKPATGATCVNTQPLTIGVKHRLDLKGTPDEYAAWFTGRIDDVRVYGRALPIAQIRQAKNSALE